jgi:hypothetical protein
MGMEPFVAASDGTFGNLIASTPDPIEEMRKAIAFKVGLERAQADAQAATAQAAAIGEKISRARMFQQDLSAVQANPTPQNISALMMKYPEFGDNIKGSWDLKDKAQRDADLTSIGQVYTPALSGDWQTAAKAAHERHDADKAAGQSTPEDEQFLSQIDAAAQGDKQAQRSVLTYLGFHAAAAAGAEHFATVYGALKGGYTLDAGATRYDDNGNIVAQSPFLKTEGGGILERDDAGATGGTHSPAKIPLPTSAPDAGTPPSVVATTLAQGGVPAPVVAGFLGNFHVEGGYGGAKGDGGSANGIGQWRGARAANFEKVMGKPIEQATPQEQAQFVLWELKNPEAAGMTEEQRDAVLNATSPQHAATLIDKFYERSSGEDRSLRVAAAKQYAQVGVPATATDASGQQAPPGFHWVVPPKQPEAKDSFRILAPAEAQTMGLDPNTKYQINDKTGQVTAVGGQQRQAKQIPQQVQTKAQASIDVRDTMARLAGTWKPAYGGHTILGDNLNTLQRTLGSWSGAPEGMANWWADFQNMDNLIRNQLFGSALTEHEKQAYAATTITPRMDPKEIAKRFNTRRNIINAVVARQQNFLKKNGYDPEAVDALFQPLGASGGGDTSPVRVRSVQEAQKLAPGTLYLAPDGKVRRR